MTTPSSPAPRASFSLVLDLVVLALLLSAGVWLALQPGSSEADRYICPMFWASFRPALVVLGSVAMAAGLGLLLVRALGNIHVPTAIRWVGLVAVVVLAVLIVRGQRRADALCRYQKRELARVTASAPLVNPTPPNPNPEVEKQKAKNREELLATAAREVFETTSNRILPVAGARALVNGQYERLQGSLERVGNEAVEAERKGEDLVEKLAQAEAENPKPPAEPALHPPMEEGLSNGDPQVQLPPPPPSTDKKGGVELPPEVGAALMAGCLAAGVTAPVCAIGTAVLAEVIQIKMQGKEITTQDLVRLAGTVASAIASQSDPNYQPSATDLPLEEAGKQALKLALKELENKGHIDPKVTQAIEAVIDGEVVLDPSHIAKLLNCYARLLDSGFPTGGAAERACEIQSGWLNSEQLDCLIKTVRTAGFSGTESDLTKAYRSALRATSCP